MEFLKVILKDFKMLLMLLETQTKQYIVVNFPEDTLKLY